MTNTPNKKTDIKNDKNNPKDDFDLLNPQSWLQKLQDKIEQKFSLENDFNLLNPQSWLQKLQDKIKKKSNNDKLNNSIFKDDKTDKEDELNSPNPQSWLQKLQGKIEQKFSLENELNLLNPQSWLQKLQDEIEQKFSNDNNQVILKQSGRWASAITWVLISGTSFVIAWISIAETEEIVITTGKLVPKGGVIDVQMPIQGVAREILIKEGDKVKKGDVLIRLDTDITQANYDALKKSLEINNSIKEKLAFLSKEGAASELQYLQQLEKIENIKSDIKSNLVQLKYQEILSPANGIVFELEPKSPGYVARSTQPVLKIVPSENLIAKVEIATRAIGFVNVGKPVEISIDSFPATDFGVIEGTVMSIGSDALPPDPSQGKGSRFPATISLKNQYLKIKNGKKLPLQAGMSLSANIKLRKVTYIQLLLNKFGDKSKSIKSI